MPLDINGYNASFNAFVKFAKDNIDVNKKKAVARFGDGGAGPLDGRTITAADPQVDKVGKLRKRDQKDLNNAVRTAFRDAIIDMFGGETKIPANVRKAMLFGDYDKGKPLTAHRIMAVKIAIDRNGAMRQKGIEENIDTRAIAKGYNKGELPKLATAVNLLSEATGCTEAEALEQVTTPGSNANRLMNYGGRFLKSAENFRNGLRLMNSFSEWFDQNSAALDNISKGRGGNYTEGMSKTLLNASTDTFCPKYKIGMEKFIFEELAFNPSLNLAETDNNKIFGIEYNNATKSIARNHHYSRTQTFAQIPPEKRTLFLKAVNVFCPIYASTVEQAKIPNSERRAIRDGKVGYLTGRILKNFDKVAALEKQGKLTPANLVKLCFPEIKNPGRDPIGAVIDLFDEWYADMYGDFANNKLPKFSSGVSGSLQDVLEATGCTFDEAVEVVEGRLELPNVQHYSSGSLPINAFDGTTDEARSGLVGDLGRPTNYSFAKEGKQLLTNVGFRFNLPGGESLVTNSTAEGEANVKTVADKLAELCGKSHPRQASSLMMMTSQSGLASLRGALNTHGIVSDEHSSVDFTINRNDTTGDITVRYSSPKELPFAFEWTATISLDGYVSSTPMRFIDEATLKEEKATTAEVIKNAMYISTKPPEVKDKVASLLVGNASTDRDLMALLRMDKGNVVNGLVVNGENNVRSDEKIAERLEALRGNVNELRMAANGNKRIFDAGLRQLALLSGTALKSGAITKMCQMIAKEDLSWIGKLTPASSPEKLCENIFKLDNLVRRIRQESKAMHSFGKLGGADFSSVKQLIMSLIFAHCDQKTLQGVHDAFHSDNLTKMMAGLSKIGDGEFPAGSNIQSNIRVAMSNFANTFNITGLQEMLNVVVGEVGGDNELPDYTQTSISDSSYKKLVAVFEDGAAATQALNQAEIADLQKNMAQ